MLRIQVCSDLSFNPPGASTPFDLHRNSVSYGWNVDKSLVFHNCSNNTWKITGVSHSWKSVVFKHIGSIWGRSEQSNISLIL
jgi:hypothetical protein